ncbi:RAD51-associated protein 2 [Macrotis lagotis]|uniref:RAD51-associated protein 2 n=1 Tax=Macrotis lagotis TaxID=92651 RepID=UPI003D68FD4C
MEGAAGGPSGPPRAKRPRLGGDTPCGPGAGAPERGPKRRRPRRRAPPPVLGPPLSGLPAPRQVSGCGAGRGARGPAPKAPRGAPAGGPEALPGPRPPGRRVGAAGALHPGPSGRRLPRGPQPGVCAPALAGEGARPAGPRAPPGLRGAGRALALPPARPGQRALGAAPAWARGAGPRLPPGPAARGGAAPGPGHLAFFCYAGETPPWDLGNPRVAGSEFRKDGRGRLAVVPTEAGRDAARERNFLLLTVQASSSDERREVQACGRYKGSLYVSAVPGACHLITAQDRPAAFKEYHSSSRDIPKDTLFCVFDGYAKVLLLSNFGDVGRISLFERDCKSDGKTIRYVPQLTQGHQNNTTEHLHRTNTDSQDTLLEKKQRFHSRSFDSKLNCFLDMEQQVKLGNHDAIDIRSNTINKTQQECVGNFLSGGEEKIQDLIWNEEKCPIENLTGIHSYQSSNERQTEKEMECSPMTTNTMVCILTSTLLMKGKPNFKNASEINQIHGNQNGTTDRNEHQPFFQENALANSKLFHSNNESTEFVNQKFKTDLATRDIECSPDLSTECLLTETKKTSDFEMKDKFDIVLKELCMFHEIEKEEDTLANSRLFHSKNEFTELDHNLKTDLSARNKYSPDITAECLSTETKTVSDFEMKSEFDIVLRELCLFHEIGKEEEMSYIGETRNNKEKSDFGKDNSVKELHQKIKEDLTVDSEKISAPSLPCDIITRVTIPKRDQSSFKWKKIHTDQEKEVPRGYCSSTSFDDELLHSPSGKDFEKALSQNPALFSDALMEGRIPSLLKAGNCLSHGIVRVYPLKTCCGPIRIGLSRKAKPKQLHPYLK